VANTNVYLPQGGDSLEIGASGAINVASGGQITAAGTQASAIEALSTSGGSWDDAAFVAAFNAMKTALEDVGILATT